jgi:hypothetical protein
MIERHYFRDILLKNFEFNFGFCMPNSRNTIEYIYEMPKLSDPLSTIFIFIFFSSFVYWFHSIWKSVFVLFCFNQKFKRLLKIPI